MKKLFKILSFTLLLVSMASFSSLESYHDSNSGPVVSNQLLIKAYEAEKLGNIAYFNTKQCAINAGFTLTGVVAMLPPSQVFTCI